MIGTGWDVPATLLHLVQAPGGTAWLAALPALRRQVLAEWGLVPDGPPYPGGTASLVLPVTRAGRPLVLKIAWPHPEAAREADALDAWDGEGAVRLLAHDPERRALLLERCDPGTPLWAAAGVDRLGVLSSLLPRLWVAAPKEVAPLAEEARGWARALPAAWERAGKPCERRLVDAALAAIHRLAGTQPEEVLLHQDLHAGNVLAAGRAPWLVIDPKPLRGERAFSVAPIVRGAELGEGRTATLGRLDRLCEDHGLCRDRALGWTLAQTMAWGFGGRRAAMHHECARWLLDAA